MDSRPSSKREEERARHPTVESLPVKTDLRETVKFPGTAAQSSFRGTKQSDRGKGKLRTRSRWKRTATVSLGGELVCVLTQETDHY